MVEVVFIMNGAARHTVVYTCFCTGFAKYFVYNLMRERAARAHDYCACAM